MKIALISDIPDNKDAMIRALTLARDKNCPRLFFLGDLGEPVLLLSMRVRWHGIIDFVLGNNDWPAQEYSDIASKLDDVNYHGDCAQLNCEGRALAFTHMPSRALKLATSGQFDAVFFGHTHCAEQTEHAGIILANPGELQGRSARLSFGIYDTEAHSVQIIPL